MLSSFLYIIAINANTKISNVTLTTNYNLWRVGHLIVLEAYTVDITAYTIPENYRPTQVVELTGWNGTDGTIFIAVILTNGTITAYNVNGTIVADTSRLRVSGCYITG